ncbi:dehydrogenase/reductase SDR family member on chromosome X [Erpetoichthys calabaricus]|uniref:Polyprenol dehydrogenase n=1 Tax=Erpetoichthys calabaricus TaxID=27687 RepID=A0A8C4SMA1_ERPCA|nr:dehydrogenase/reductase SDR family member on chromosome X [Erpetoichthys calabaricus]
MSFLALVIPLLKVYYVGLKVLLYQLFNESFTLPAFPKQNGRVAIVTGGVKGIGFETARHLARLGMHVIIAGHIDSEGQEAVKRIKAEYPHDKVEFEHLDLTSLNSVCQFVKSFKNRGLPLHVLVNNAAVMLVPQRRTKDGFEEHIGLNYLGHFLLTSLLLDTLKTSGSADSCSRVVTVSSATHYVGSLNLEDLQSSCCYSPYGAYAQSKLALVMFTYHLQQQLLTDGSHVTANVVDPGVVNTDLYQHISWPAKLCKWIVAWFLFRTPEQGASTSIYAAVAPDLEGTGGCYLYNGQKVKSADITYDEQLQHQLYHQSCDLVRIAERSR